MRWRYSQWQFQYLLPLKHVSECGGRCACGGQCSPTAAFARLRYRAIYRCPPTCCPTCPRRFTPEVLQGVVAALRDGDDHHYGCEYGEFDNGMGHGHVGPGRARGGHQVPQLDLIYLDCTFADLPLVGTG